MSPTQGTIDNYANSIREIAWYWLLTWLGQIYLTERPTHGHYECLMRVLSCDYPELYQNFVRMNEAIFNEIVEQIQPSLEKQCTFLRKPLDVGLWLAVTLCFLALGYSYKDVAFDFRVTPIMISYIPLWCRTNTPNIYIHRCWRAGQWPVHWGSLRIKYIQYGLTVFNSDQLRTIWIDCVSIAAPLRFNCGCSAVAAGCVFI